MLPDKTWQQIQIKYEKLRRSYTNNKRERSVSGAAGGRRIYDDEMDALWNTRPKLNIPHDIGIDTDDTVIISAPEVHGDDMSLNESNVQEDSCQSNVPPKRG